VKEATNGSCDSKMWNKRQFDLNYLKQNKKQEKNLKSKGRSGAKIEQLEHNPAPDAPRQEQLEEGNQERESFTITLENENH
jgi:hypothetical protein